MPLTSTPSRSTARRHATVLLTLAAAVGSTAFAAAPHAYVGNQQNGTVSIIDTERDEVVRTLPDQGKIGEKIQAVIADLAEKTVFVVDATGNTLVAVDIASGQIRQRIAVGKSPEGASLSPSGKTIAVCVEDDNLVALVDVASATIARKIPTQGKNPEHCVFSADEHWLLTSNENSNDVDIIDLNAGKSVALVHTSGHPRGIALLANVAYVVQETSGGVDVLDLLKHSVLRSIATGQRPADALASADGKTVFVSNGGDANIAAIDVASGKVKATVPVGKRAWNMALSGDGKKLYVANGRSNSISVIDTVALKSLKEIPVGGLPWGVSVPVPMHK